MNFKSHHFILMNKNEIFKILEGRGFEFERILSEGPNVLQAIVFSSKYQEYFVAKIMRRENEQLKMHHCEYSAEIDSLSHLTHPNVIQLYQHFVQGNYNFQILEYCCGGSFSDLISSDKTFNESELKNLGLQVIDALLYCTENNIAHCDIRPSNILIDGYGRPKISDFRLAQFIIQGNVSKSIGNSTSLYRAPEVIENKLHDPFKADVWSVGVILYELFTKKMPWFSRRVEDVTFMIKKGITNFPENMSRDLKMTIQAMVQPDPKKRVGLKDCLSLPFFSSSSSKKLSKQLTQKKLSCSLNLRNVNLSLLTFNHPINVPEKTKSSRAPAPPKIQFNSGIYSRRKSHPSS